MEQFAIEINNLKKQYRLGQIGGGTLRADLQSWWARLRGKDDPNTFVGLDPARIGQRFWALEGIDLKIKKGEAVGIIGSNGAGKSTLLKVLSRITAPTKGSVDVYGRIASMLEVGTGFHPEMTGRENVYLNGAILGMTKAEIDAKMEDIIEFSEVRQFIDTPVKRYSSGMYVKLAFSVAAHLDAEILIMDEVLAVGDMAFQKKCLDKMRNAATVEGKTVLYVSHNMNTIRRLCDRCVVLDKGRVVFDGAVEDAIGVYLRLGGVSRDTDTDLKTTPRRHHLLGKQAAMERVRLPGRQDVALTRGEGLTIAVTWRAQRDLEDVCLRLTVRNREDAVVGMAQSVPLAALAEGQVREDAVVFDTAMLADGTYYLSPALYHKGSGGGALLDLVDRAVTIEVTSPPEDAVENWTSRMGNIRFPEMPLER